MTAVKSEITVILPFYNAEKTLDRAIESIASQSFEKFVCILIDNNSTDGSVEIAKRWTKRDQRFNLIHESRQGVMFASNAGSVKACGNYIARMDADDWSYPERLKLQAGFLDKNPDYGAVSGLVEHVGHNDNTEGMARFVDWSNSIRSYQEIMNSRFIELPIVNPSAMWRREVGERYGMYRKGDFPEDYELWLRWLSKGVKILKLEETVIKWNDSENRLTRTDSLYSDSAFYNTKTRFLAEWLETNFKILPRIAVWGASRISRRRARQLIKYGIEPEFYIDTKKNRQLDQKVIYYEDLPVSGNFFILTYIRQMNAREEIREFLNERGYKEGVNFIMVS